MGCNRATHLGSRVGTWMSRDVPPKTPASSSQPVFFIIAHTTKLLFAHKEGFHYVWLQLCETTGQKVLEPQCAGTREATASIISWATAASWMA